MYITLLGGGIVWVWVCVGGCGAMGVIFCCFVESVCGCHWVPCFALEYIELVALLNYCLAVFGCCVHLAW